MQNLMQQGLNYYKSGNYKEAKIRYKQILNLKPKHIDALHLMGLCFLAEQDFPSAIKYISKALKIQPNTPVLLFNLALSYYKFNNNAKAINYFNKLIKLFPKEQHSNMALFYLGSIYEQQKNFLLAITQYKNLLNLEPNNINAMNNLANLLTQQGELEPAKQLLENLLSLQPDHVHALNNLGNVHLSQKNYSVAKYFYEKALILEPHNLTTKYNLGLALYKLKSLTAAKQIFTDILNSYDEKAKFYYALCLAESCDWEKLEDLKPSLPKSYAISPFDALILNLDSTLLPSITNNYLQRFKFNINNHNYNINNTPRKRIGYLSPDFNNHPVGFLIEEVLLHHNTNNLEIFVLSLSSTPNIATFKAEHFIDLANLSDHDAIEQIAKLNLDYLIDLAGYTENARPRILNAKPAKRQAHWLGYPISLYNNMVDDYIAHNSFIPESCQQYFTENILYHPSCWIAKSNFPNITTAIDRNTYNLPKDPFIFCCFTRAYRITKELFMAWMEILKHVPDSILWLQGNDYLEHNFKKYATELGVNSNRLYFKAPGILTTDYPQRLADLWLDTWQMSSGTASLITIASGTPVLALQGNLPHMRSSSAMNIAANLSSMNVASPQEYIESAIYIAKHKQHNIHVDRNSPLFNIKKFVQEFEDLILSKL